MIRFTYACIEICAWLLAKRPGGQLLAPFVSYVYSKEQINTFKVIRILCGGLTVQYLILRVAHSSVYNHITHMSVTNPYRFTVSARIHTPNVFQVTANFLVFGVRAVCPADINRRHYVNRQITSPRHARVSIPYQSSSLNPLNTELNPICK